MTVNDFDEFMDATTAEAKRRAAAIAAAASFNNWPTPPKGASDQLRAFAAAEATAIIQPAVETASRNFR